MNTKEIIDFVNKNKKLIQEVSSAGGLGGGEVDDGPRGYWGDVDSYENASNKMAEKLGMTVVNNILGKNWQRKIFDKYGTDYPKGPPQSVTYFPAGKEEKAGEKFVGAGTNYSEFKGKKAYVEWALHIQRITRALGWKYIHDKETKELAIKESKFSENWWSLKLAEGENKNDIF